MNNNLIKILIVGDNETGKSNLLLRKSENKYVDSYIKTIGTDFKVIKGVLENNNSNYTIQIWDYVSNDHIGPFNKEMLKNLNFIIFLFDLTNKQSFLNISKWIEKYNKNDDINNNNIIKILVGNKLDLVDERVINSEMYKNNDIIPESFFKNYYEISVKENININNLFNDVVELYFEQNKHQENQQNTISNNDNKEKKKKKFHFF